MTDNVVTLRAASVADIPAMLRRMADQIEKGEVEASSALFIIPREGDWPDIYGWGEHLGDHGNIAVCEMAKTWFINNLVARRTEDTDDPDLATHVVAGSGNLWFAIDLAEFEDIASN